MTHKIRNVDVEKFAYYVNKLRQNVGLETCKWRQIVASQTAHTKYKWPPYDPEPTTPWKFSAYATANYQLSLALAPVAQGEADTRNIDMLKTNV